MSALSSNPSSSVTSGEINWNFRRILLLFFVLSLPLINPIVHGDGVGYYAYARAPLIQHDFRFEEDWRHANQNFTQSRTRPDGQLTPGEYTETGYVGNLFTVGPALLWAPFLIVAHLSVLSLDVLGAHIPANGFSLPYIFAMALGTATYGFLGLLLSFSLARKYVAEQWAFLATIGIWLATSLPVYMYFNPAWSHAHSAFVVALFLWYWDRTRPARSTGQWFILGVISGLLIDVYFPNGVFLLLPLIESVILYFERFKAGLRETAKLFAQNLLFTSAVAAMILPTLITRYIIFGGIFRFGSYSHLGWDWSAPNWLSVLVASDHGVLSWTPLIGLALLGLFFPPRGTRILTLYMGVACVAFYYLIASYPYWDGLSSFGNRFFISLTPIFVFGLALFLAALGRFFKNSRTTFIAFGLVLLLFAIWNGAFIFQWGAHLIPVRGPISWNEMVYNQFHVVPRQISQQVRIYVFRRNVLMQQIEQKDSEQLRKSAQP
jgi:hypothetical protein